MRGVRVRVNSMSMGIPTETTDVVFGLNYDAWTQLRFRGLHCDIHFLRGRKTTETYGGIADTNRNKTHGAEAPQPYHAKQVRKSTNPSAETYHAQASTPRLQETKLPSRVSPASRANPSPRHAQNVACPVCRRVVHSATHALSAANAVSATGRRVGDRRARWGFGGPGVGGHLCQRENPRYEPEKGGVKQVGLWAEKKTR